LATIPSDPNFSDQWYLRNTTEGQLDLNVVDVWDDYTGQGILVTVWDDSLRFTHDDLDDNYDTTTDFDYLSGDGDPSPDNPFENHGTPVAGIVAAEANNGLGGVGVAYEATIRGYKILGTLGAIVRDAAGIGSGTGNPAGSGNGGDILNMSFGSNPFATPQTGPLNALADASAQGRGGLGQIHVKSAGNTRGADDPNFEPMDASRFTITVAALREDGWVASYSSPGASVHVSGFAVDDSSSNAIFTTSSDNDTAFTHTFGGTSAAAPQVSGVVALMLEANPDLGWRDVHTILAYTARHVGSDVDSPANSDAPLFFYNDYEIATQTNGATWFRNASETVNGQGLHYSNDYGFGLVDALAAVRLAEVWDKQSTSANEVAVTLDLDGANAGTVVPDNDAAGLTYSATLGTDVLIENVAVDLSFVSNGPKRLGDLDIWLTSPEGTRIQISNAIGFGESAVGVWTYGARGFLGETAAGTWTIQVRDVFADRTVEITDLQLNVYGSTLSDDDVFILTNEVDARDGGDFTLDGGSGSDVFNAAAYSGGTTIDIVSGQVAFAETSVQAENIESFIGGGGSDTVLVGDDAQLPVNAGRGDDIFLFENGVSGLFGSLILDGGVGDDTLLLSGAGIFDFGFANFANIEELRFDLGINQSKRVILSDKELDGADELQSIAIVGNPNEGGADTVQVNMSFFADLDLSGWHFQSFGSSVPATGDLDAIVVVGTTGNNTITGTSQADTLLGRSGADLLLGQAGDDLLNGGSGADSLVGASGVDLADYSDSPSAVTVDFNSGSIAGGDAAGDSYSSIEGIVGSSFADRLTGGLGQDYFFGGDGNDSLNGRGGIDRLFGGSGEDVFLYSARASGRNSFDSFAGGSGQDVLRVSDDNTIDFTFARFSSIEEIEFQAAVDEDKEIVLSSRNFDADGELQEILIDGNAIDGTSERFVINLSSGNDLDLSAWSFEDFDSSVDDRIVVNGDAGNNMVTGSSQAETVFGGDGDDALGGGGGDDSLVGGSGTDTAIFSGHRIDYEILADGSGGFQIADLNSLDGDEGSDSLSGIEFASFAGHSFDLSLVGETVTFAPTGMFQGGRAEDPGTGQHFSLAGMAGASGSFIGTSGYDRLEMHSGFDYLADFFDIGYAIFYDRAPGPDGLQINSIEEIVLTAADDLLDFSARPGRPAYDGSMTGLIDPISGRTFDVRIDLGDGDDVFIGGASDESVSGGSGLDILFGNSGSDILNGGAGDDSLTGGSGADLFVFGGPDAADGDANVIADLDFALGDSLILGLSSSDAEANVSIADTIALREAASANDQIALTTGSDTLVTVSTGGGVTYTVLLEDLTI